MVDSNKARAHGQTGAEETAKGLAKDLDNLVDLPVEKPVNLTRAFQRMRTDWNSADREIIRQVQADVDRQIFDAFAEAYEIEYEIYDLVRAPEVDEATGEIKTDADGLTIWATSSSGKWIEDWSKINSTARERLLYEIITKMFNWEQRSADAFGEALFAKAVWEEAFSTGFDTSPDVKKTVEARTAYGNRVAADHRYLAVYKSLYSKKADAVVRSMLLLAQRLKDLHV